MTMRSCLLRAFAVLCAAGSTAVGGVAHADPSPEAAAAEMLDAEGTASMQEHRYAEACPKLAESYRLQPGTGVLLRLALCNAQLGKTATAWWEFREAAARARQSGDDSLRLLATRHADTLVALVPRITLVLAPGGAREPVVVRMDGQALDRAVLGAPIPMDPGTHVVEATSSGRPPFRQTVLLAAGDPLLSVTVTFPALAPADGVGPVVAAKRDSPGWRTAAIASAGVGLASIAAGTFLGLTAISAWNKAQGECPSGTECTNDALSRHSTASTNALWSTVAFVGGGVSLAGAGILWLWAPRPSPPGQTSSAPTLAPTLERDRWGLALTGSFR